MKQYGGRPALLDRQQPRSVRGSARFASSPKDRAGHARDAPLGRRRARHDRCWHGTPISSGRWWTGSRRRCSVTVNCRPGPAQMQSREPCSHMRSDSIVFAIAGIVLRHHHRLGHRHPAGARRGATPVQLQQSRPHPRRAAPAAQAPRPPRQPPPLDEGKVQSLLTIIKSDPKNAGAHVQLGNTVLRRRALSGCDQVVRGGAQARSEERRREHRPRRQLLLLEPPTTRSKQFDHSLTHRTRSTPRRCSTRASCCAFGKQDLKGAAEAWQQVVAARARHARRRRPRSRALEGIAAAHAGAGASARACTSRRMSRARPAPRIIVLLLVVRAVMAHARRHDRRISGGAVARRRRGGSRAPVKLVRDPVCGTYVVARSRRIVATAASTRTSAPRSAATSVARVAGCADEHPSRRTASRRHRRSRPAAVRARLRRLERRQHQRAPRRRPAAHDAQERVEGLHDARHDGASPTSTGKKLAGDRDPSSELQMHLEVYRNRPDVQRRRARASADRDRLRRRRHSARSRACSPKW